MIKQQNAIEHEKRQKVISMLCASYSDLIGRQRGLHKAIMWTIDSVQRTPCIKGPKNTDVAGRLVKFDILCTA